MINLENIGGRRANDKLVNYTGKNPYIQQLKVKFLNKKGFTLTEKQSRYIVNNFDKDPQHINKVVEITEYLGNELKRVNNISFTPKKILIEYMLSDSGKTFHILGKLKRNQKKSNMYFIPKSQVIDDPYFEEIEIDVDFDKYEKLDEWGRNPYEHQRTGIEFLLTRPKCILADDMGLGKTYQTVISALESGAERILIVCPSSLKLNWEREINAFCDDTHVVNGRDWGDDHKFKIVNFDILKNFHTVIEGRSKEKKAEREDYDYTSRLVQSNFDMVIIDEAHFLKNPKSIRGKIMVDLCVRVGVDRVWLLTGTPIANRPMDYFNLLNIIQAPIADNFNFYAKRYCEGRNFYKKLKNGKKKQIWLTNGASNLEELSIKTRNLMLRRIKNEVLDMPDKTITPIYYDFTKTQRNKYEDLWDEYLEVRKAEGKRGNIQKELVELILLRKFVCDEMIKNTIHLAENALEQGQKVIIFTNFTDELIKLNAYFGKLAVCHNGPMSSKEKQKSVDDFQNKDDVKVFIGNIKSAGVGITLTSANIVIFNSFDWVPGNNEQCEDRAYRIGQQNNVTVYYQLFNNTISSMMWNVLKNKKEVIDTIIGENKYDDDEVLDLMATEMLNEYGIKN